MNGSNPKRMYVVENTRDFVRSHNLKPGSVLSFYCAPDGQLVRPSTVPYQQAPSATAKELYLRHNANQKSPSIRV